MKRKRGHVAARRVKPAFSRLSGVERAMYESFDESYQRMKRLLSSSGPSLHRVCQRARLVTEGVQGMKSHLRAGGLDRPVGDLSRQTLMRRDVRPRAVRNDLLPPGLSLPA